MRCKFPIRALVAAGALALMAGPALAQSAGAIITAPLCPPIGAAPAEALPPMPPMPAGVTKALVIECTPNPRMTSAANMPTQCRAAPVVTYIAALAARHGKVVAFRVAVGSWQAQADSYAACVMKNYD